VLGDQNKDASVLYDVTFLTYGAVNGWPKAPDRSGLSAALEDGISGFMADCKVMVVGSGGTAEVRGRDVLRRLRLPSTLTDWIASVQHSEPRRGGSIYDLPDYIEQLELAGFSPRRHKVLAPQTNWRAVLSGADGSSCERLSMRPYEVRRQGRLPCWRLSCWGSVCILFAALRHFLGENGQIPVSSCRMGPAPSRQFFLGSFGLSYTQRMADMRRLAPDPSLWPLIALLLRKTALVRWLVAR